MRKYFAKGLCLIFLLALADGVSATIYYGCLKCKHNSPVGFGGYCVSVGHEEYGEGTQCNETATGLPWPNHTDCTLSGSPCYNVVVTDGGSGGGGNNACGTTGFCPAECFSCSGGGGRPAI